MNKKVIARVEIFPTMFTEMKGIAGDLGEMKIPLKLEARSVRH